MKKPYGWKEIREFLVKELNKTKHIMTFGTIGSCDVGHDIDTIITKKPNSKTSLFYREIHNIFSSLDNYLKEKYNSHAVRIAISEEEVLIPGFLKGENNLFFHTDVHTSYPQIERHWNWALFEDVSLKKILAKYDCLIGSMDNLYSDDFKTKTYYDPLFIFLSRYDKINSHYPKKLLIDAMNHYFDYLFRKRLGLKTPVAKNEKEVREIFYNLCDKLDELNKKHRKCKSTTLNSNG